MRLPTSANMRAPIKYDILAPLKHSLRTESWLSGCIETKVSIHPVLRKQDVRCEPAGEPVQGGRKHLTANEAK